ncbi:hypothetical protein AXF42_Ash019409 [Apostasia shenzhenica]|uniref:Uncharacterized protein n=1 Tax=Apostasia shenzhenica TaxID=1088818 RepID=A0A2I0B4V1_9ASPA|nr:hypothetical protein AXF42_Ash019409 [Apostasia shenzhenica]
MFSLQENASRRFDPSMSRRTRKPEVFVENTNGFHENDLEMLSNVALENGNDSTQSSLDLCVLHQRSSLKELMTENCSRSKREEGISRSADISRGADEKKGEVLEGEERSSLAIVAKKSGFVGKYMKVLNHLIKEKGFHAKKRSMIKLPMR